MHPVVKGELGEFAVFKKLKEEGLHVFPEMGNSSRVDVIAMDHLDRLYKIQVKCTTSVDGAALLYLNKNTLNPKYNYKYTARDVDVYALYIEDIDKVAFIPSSLIFADKETRKSMTIRTEMPRNGQTNGIHLLSDYLLFPIAPAPAAAF